MIIVRTERWLAAAAFLSGTIAWVVYLQHGLVLSHYDAKAHLVVARRVIDNLTPGWQQLGAVWLPLPHLIQVLPTQVDVLYRTGAFGSMLSILAFTVTVWALARFAMLMTASRLGAVTTGLLLVLNPNLLYLQSTPMTELLLLALTSLVTLWMYEWLASGAAERERAPARLGWTLFAAMWTRYEAWPVVASALVVAACVVTTGSGSGQTRSKTKPGFLVLRLAAWPAAAVVLFVLNSRLTVGSWFVSGGFYLRDPLYDAHAWRSLVAVWWGTNQLSGYVSGTVALIAAAAVTIRAIRGGSAQPAALVAVALFAAAALPFYAFYEGHPYRVRYMVSMVAACALFCGLAVGMVRRPRHEPQRRRDTEFEKISSVPLRLCGLWSPALAALLIGSSLVESPVWSRDAPMIAEARWDAPRSLERRAVTACLGPRYRGERVMASMGSLAHYMQELSHEGLAIADFLHEGNGAIWQLAMETGPAPHAGWMLVEEQSEGGDVLAQRVREDPAFTRGMVRVCEGGGVALYRRQP